uniref:Endonuclease GajA/Old nuclease/RecF-like AAA domain-containing protein n=1 Tax=Cyanothece sp. (strain PCC 7425 / ATCC 29141) TaxID=395961 RepID=B8HUR0_CYAP4
MLKNLKIENFRCFKSFELKELGQLNLLVGKNNSGKTSILEAIQLIVSESYLEALREVILNRNEYILSEENSGVKELDIRHLFYGHKIEVGKTLSIVSDYTNEKIAMSVIVDHNKTQRLENLEELLLVVEHWGRKKISNSGLPLSTQNGLPIDYVRSSRRDFANPSSRTQFVKSSSLTVERMVELFDQVVLMPEERFVIEALNTIEPSIERIAPVGFHNYRINNFSSGFVIKIANSNQRIPIGSMGEGIWRMLGLALALVNARDGVLLVDDIDTGLHFTTMSDMWKLVWETAKRLNVQVFATTHSSDCWKSLDAIASQENPSDEGITIHRIEKGKSRSVVFTEEQVVIAAERDIEVR